MSCLLSAQLLGGFSVRTEKSPRDFPYDKVRALLALLLSEPRPLPREWLAERLWPERTTAEARGNLRAALFHLNRVLGETAARQIIDARRTTLGLQPGAPVETDLNRLLALLHGQHTADSVATIATLYRGPFLHGLDLSDSPPFDEWLEERRQSIARQTSRWLMEAANQLYLRGEFTAALQAAELNVEIDPWDEPGHRLLMQLLMQNGQYGRALAHHARLRTFLAEELDVAPEPATEALADEIRAQRTRQAEAAPANPPLQGLRPATVLCCELVPTHLDPNDIETWAGTTDQGRDQLARTIVEQGGHLHLSQGHRLLAYFGIPLAREHAAYSAAATALQLREQAQTLALSVRIGLHSGLLLGDDVRQPDRAGLISLIASRLRERAAPIALSGATCALVRKAFICRPDDSLTIPGLAQPVSVHQLLEARPSPITTLPPFIGRKSERLALEEAWQACLRGAFHSLLLQGPPGIGKSRLAHEFISRQLGRHPVRVIECTEQGRQTPFAALLTLLRQQRPVWPEGDASQLLQELLEPGSSGLPAEALAHPVTRARLIETVSQRLHPEAGTAAALLLVEDIHWIDPSSLEVLRHLSQQRPPHLLLLMTSRPAETDALPLPIDHLMALHPLQDDDAARLLESLDIEPPLAPDVQTHLLRRAGGIPLFLQELAHDPSRHQTPAAPLPLSLQALLAARIDRLPADRTRLLQAAAIGATFDRRLLAVIAQEPDVTPALSRLLGEGLIERTDDANTYRFHHTLYHDAAYGWLPAATRHLLHRAIADALEGALASLAADRPELIAHHREAGGEFEAAVRSWLKAGRHAAMRGADIEAIRHYQRGLRLLANHPLEAQIPLEVDLQLALGAALMAQGGYGCREAVAAYDRARSLATGDPSLAARLFEAQFGVWQAASTRWNFTVAMQLADELVAQAEPLGHPLLIGLAHFARGSSLFSLSHFEAARTALQSAVDSIIQAPPAPADAFGGDDPETMARGFLAWAAWHQGDRTLARQSCEAALQRARTLGRPAPLANALAFAAYHARLNEEVSHTETLVHELLELTQQQDLALWRAAGLMLKGWSLARRGDPSGIPCIHQGLERVRHAMGGIEGLFHVTLADAHAALGDHDAQQQAVQHALAIADRNHNHYLRVLLDSAILQP